MNIDSYRKPPSAPSSPIITSITSMNNQLQVYFTQSYDGGSSITNYQYSTDNGSTFNSFSPIQTTSLLIISSLTNGITYQVQIKAVNAIGTGSSSNTVSGTPITVPSAPIITSIKSELNTLIVNFLPPFDGGSSITNYEYSINNGTSFTTLSPSQTTSPITITSLTIGTTYQVQIRAVNILGSGSVSNTMSGIPCLLKGIKIKMEDGSERKVEEVREGELVVDLLERTIPVKKVFTTTVIGDENNIPFVIPKDFFEKNVPNEDIYLSYNHAFFYCGWKLPIHNDNLKQDKSLIGREITYYHFQLPNYSEDKLVCHGLPVDSYDVHKNLL